VRGSSDTAPAVRDSFGRASRICSDTHGDHRAQPDDDYVGRQFDYYMVEHGCDVVHRERQLVVERTRLDQWHRSDVDDGR